MGSACFGMIDEPVDAVKRVYDGDNADRLEREQKRPGGGGGLVKKA